eukprot:TRINITY_DN2818_c0_g1_i1.p1 TRINITY_DN2818_c0_g1~~TRINITY_DN2818_c0_g1_i1.p1  ORF type:complete len:409 (-),score=59.54 TRINITY_DN2818_c0_g1_i1:68-1294(-)
MPSETSISDSLLSIGTKRKKSSKKQQQQQSYRPIKRQKKNFSKNTTTTNTLTTTTSNTRTPSPTSSTTSISRTIAKKEEQQEFRETTSTSSGPLSESSSSCVVDNHEDDTQIAAFLLQLANQTPTSTSTSGGGCKLSEPMKKVPHKLPASLYLPTQNDTGVSFLPHRGQVIVDSPQQHYFPHVCHNVSDLDPTNELNDVLALLHNNTNKQQPQQPFHDTNKPTMTFKPTPLRVRANHPSMSTGTTYGNRNEVDLLLPPLNMDINRRGSSSLPSLFTSESQPWSSGHYLNHISAQDSPFSVPVIRQNNSSDSYLPLKLRNIVPSFHYTSMTKTPTTTTNNNNTPLPLSHRHGFSTPFELDHVHSFIQQSTTTTTTINGAPRSQVLPKGVVVPSFSTSNMPTKSPRIPIN